MQNTAGRQKCQTFILGQRKEVMQMFQQVLLYGWFFTAGKLSSFFLWLFCQYISIHNSLRYQGFVFFNSQELEHRIFLVHQYRRCFIVLQTNITAMTSCENKLQAQKIFILYHGEFTGQTPDVDPSLHNFQLFCSYFTLKILACLRTAHPT